MSKLVYVNHVENAMMIAIVTRGKGFQTFNVEREIRIANLGDTFYHLGLAAARRRRGGWRRETRAHYSDFSALGAVVIIAAVRDGPFIRFPWANAPSSKRLAVVAHRVH